MSIKLKAFIYRFSNIFGLHIYLAQKEEDAGTFGVDEEDKGLYAGLWQAKRGFTTVWTYRQPWHKALIAKIKHAFEIKEWKDD